MRISSAVLLALAVVACGRQQADPAALSNAIDTAKAQSAGDETIDCAPAHASDFARNCAVERTQSDQGLVLTVRNPDGGFHRLQVVSDGRGVISADGAEAAKVTLAGDGRIEVAIGGDRYRLPATVKAKAGK